MYEKHDPDVGPDREVCGGWEAVEDADVPPWVAVLGVVGYYVGRALLALGLVCFLGAAALLVADALGVAP